MKKQIEEFLLNNVDILEETAKEIISYDGSFEELDVQVNDENVIDEMFEFPSEAVRAVIFGEYSYSDEYIRFNAYGNLESLSTYEYEEELKSSVSEIVDYLVDYSYAISLHPELEELIDTLGNEEGEDDE